MVWPTSITNSVFWLAIIAAPIDHVHYEHPCACAIGGGTKFILGELSINIAKFDHAHQAYSSIMDQNIGGRGFSPKALWVLAPMCAQQASYVGKGCQQHRYMSKSPSHLMINDADANSRRAQGICSLEL